MAFPLIFLHFEKLQWSLGLPAELSKGVGGGRKASLGSLFQGWQLT